MGSALSGVPNEVPYLRPLKSKSAQEAFLQDKLSILRNVRMQSAILIMSMAKVLKLYHILSHFF